MYGHCQQKTFEGSGDVRRSSQSPTSRSRRSYLRMHTVGHSLSPLPLIIECSLLNIECCLLRPLPLPHGAPWRRRFCAGAGTGAAGCFSQLNIQHSTRNIQGSREEWLPVFVRPTARMRATTAACLSWLSRCWRRESRLIRPFPAGENRGEMRVRPSRLSR